MIGERLEAHDPFPLGALLSLTAGVGMLAAGQGLGNVGLAVGAALPIAIGGMWWLLGADRPFTGTFRDDGLMVEGEGDPVLVPYADIRNIRVGGRPANPTGSDRKPRPIAILHGTGALRIASRSNFPTHEIVRFLASRVPDRGGRDVNPALADFLRSQEQAFGPENVVTFRDASSLLTGSRRSFRAFCAGVMLGGASWLALALSGMVPEEWGVAGGAVIVAGVGLYGAGFAESPAAAPMRKLRKGASLVIGPRGMAMVQGPIQGELRWAELLEARFQDRPRAFSSTTTGMVPGILLRVKGAEILIADIYDRPLFVIHDRIMTAAELLEPIDAEF